LFAALYATRTPAWQVPDEPAHFNYARTLADTGALPVLRAGDYDGPYLETLKARRFPPELSIAPVRYESYQPPLYYAILAGLRRLAPGAGLPQDLLYLRLATAIGGSLLLALAARATWTLFPGSGALTLGVPAIIATVPQHLAIAGGVTNDLAAETVVTAALLLAFIELRRDESAPVKPAPRPSLDRLTVLMGLLVGVALLTKIHAYIALAIVAAALLLPLTARAGRRRWRARLVRLIVIAAIALLVGGWWFVRGMVVYGPTDLIGAARHDQVVTGQPLTGAITSEVAGNFLTTAFHSFWAQFGWMGVPADDRTYLFCGAVVGLGLLGLVLYVARLGAGEGRLSPPQAAGLALAALALVLTLATMLAYNLRYFQPQGRYLYPALFPIALFLALGFRQLLPQRRALAGLPLLYPALLGLDAYALFRILIPNL
jgi:hypothetical protein